MRRAETSNPKSATKADRQSPQDDGQGQTEGRISALNEPVSLTRRLAAFVYDAVLLIAMWMVVGLILVLFTHFTGIALPVVLWLALLLIAAGAFYVHFQSITGQTLGMQTWSIQLRTHVGTPVTRTRATIRYVVAAAQWLALLALIGIARNHGEWIATAITAIVVLWITSSQFHPRRWMLHDWLSGTELVRIQKLATPRWRQSGKAE